MNLLSMKSKSLVELPRGIEWLVVLIVDKFEVELNDEKLVKEFDLFSDM